MTQVQFRCGRDVLPLVMLFITAASAHVRTKPEGFYITLPAAYGTVLDVVREVCSDGLIHGTFEYEKETSIAGAAAASSSNSFPEWSGNGEVLYKIRDGAISPAHFVGSNDRGTLTVRYVVERVSTTQTHISIDAVFVENNHHHRHVSEGLVETAEFRQIAQKLKELEQQSKQKQAEVERREQQAKREKQEAEDKRLRVDLESERVRLATALDAVDKLEERYQALRHQTVARVKRVAEVKAIPALHADSLQSLGRGEAVQVLQHIPRWVRVQVPGGQEGWIYALLLEELP